MKADDKSLMEQSKRLVNLNQLEVFLGTLVALVTIANSIGSWYVLPYRLSEAEKSIARVQGELESVKISNLTDRELLVRMDERLRTVQRALKIPTDETPKNP